MRTIPAISDTTPLSPLESETPEAWRTFLDGVLIPSPEIQRRITQLADILNAWYAGLSEPLLVIAVLKGAAHFSSDLVRQLKFPLHLDFMRVSSYGNDMVAGDLELHTKSSVSPSGRRVLLLEDIIDTGRTLHTLLELLKQQSPSEVKVATLLDKPSRREVSIEADWVGFTIPDRFVVGYGLDHAEDFRNLAYIGVLSQEGQKRLVT